MTDADDRLSQFLVAHEGCRGWQIDPPSEADLTEDGYWATIRCPGCKNTIREKQTWATVLPRLAAYVGMTPEELVTLAFEEGGLEQLERRLQESRRVVPDVLMRILRARRGQSERFDN